MKKFVAMILIAAMCLSLAACSGAETHESVKDIEPQAAQMKAICELATMQCYYHNVAKMPPEPCFGKKTESFGLNIPVSLPLESTLPW